MTQVSQHRYSKLSNAYINNWYQCCGIDMYFRSKSRGLQYWYRYLIMASVLVHPHLLSFFFLQPATTRSNLNAVSLNRKVQSKTLKMVSTHDFIFTYLCRGKIYGAVLVRLSDSPPHGNKVRVFTVGWLMFLWWETIRCRKEVGTTATFYSLLRTHILKHKHPFLPLVAALTRSPSLPPRTQQQEWIFTCSLV